MNILGYFVGNGAFLVSRDTDLDWLRPLRERPAPENKRALHRMHKFFACYAKWASDPKLRDIANIKSSTVVCRHKTDLLQQD